MRLRDLDGQERFSELAGIRRGFAQIISFRILLSDGRTTLPAAGGQVRIQRSGDAIQVDALVGVEGSVFRCDDRVAHVIRQYRAVDDFAVLLRVAADFRSAVGIVDGCFFGEGELLRFGDFRGDIHVCEQADSCREQRREDAEYPLQYEMLALVLLFLRSVGAVRSVVLRLGRAMGCVAAIAASAAVAGAS